MTAQCLNISVNGDLFTSIWLLCQQKVNKCLPIKRMFVHLSVILYTNIH